MRAPPMTNPVAIFCSDIHLTLKQPACRADEDWMETQAFALNQLKHLSVELDQTNPVPVICAGDIFDRWNPSPELINFALKYLPDKMVCIPGQHDLPNHRIENMTKSGYGVLKSANKIVDLSDWDKSCMCRGVSYSGFGWNQKIRTPEKWRTALKVAVIHRYVWKISAQYPGAPKTAHVSELLPLLKGYNVAVIGDNHIPFDFKAKTGTHIFNCGGFIIRRSDEIGRIPRVGILYADGVLKSHPLRTDLDKFHPHAKDREQLVEGFDMKEFLERLEGLGEQALDFREAVKAYIRKNNVPKAVAALTLTALE
jgi:hypothetical protein